MGDEDVIVAEVEADPIENNNPIEDLLKSIETGQYTDAEQSFSDIIGSRLQDTLDQAKIRIADTMHNAQQDAEEEVDDNNNEFEEDEYDFDDEDDKS